MGILAKKDIIWIKLNIFGRMLSLTAPRVSGVTIKTSLHLQNKNVLISSIQLPFLCQSSICLYCGMFSVATEHTCSPTLYTHAHAHAHRLRNMTYQAKNLKRTKQIHTSIMLFTKLKLWLPPLNASQCPCCRAQVYFLKTKNHNLAANEQAWRSEQ